MSARSRRALMRSHRLPRDTKLVSEICASIDLAFAFYDTDVDHNQRLTYYVARCVVEDLQMRYHLSEIGSELRSI